MVRLCLLLLLACLGGLPTSSCIRASAQVTCGHGSALPLHGWDSLSSTIVCSGVVRSGLADFDGTRHLVTTGGSHHNLVFKYVEIHRQNPWGLCGSAVPVAEVCLHRWLAYIVVHSSFVHSSRLGPMSGYRVAMSVGRSFHSWAACIARRNCHQPFCFTRYRTICWQYSHLCNILCRFVHNAKSPETAWGQLQMTRPALVISHSTVGPFHVLGWAHRQVHWLNCISASLGLALLLI